MKKELFIDESTFNSFNTGRKQIQTALKDELKGASKEESRAIRGEYKQSSLMAAKEGIEKARVFVKDAHTYMNPEASNRNIAVRATGTFGLMSLMANFRNIGDIVTGS